MINWEKTSFNLLDFLLRLAKVSSELIMMYCKSLKVAFHIFRLHISKQLGTFMVDFIYLPHTCKTIFNCVHAQPFMYNSCINRKIYVYFFINIISVH